MKLAEKVIALLDGKITNGKLSGEYEVLWAKLMFEDVLYMAGDCFTVTIEGKNALINGQDSNRENAEISVSELKEMIKKGKIGRSN